MKKILAIGFPILTILGILFAYGRRYIKNLSFDVDLELKLLDVKSGFFVSPLIIYVDNKNKKSITIKNLELKIYSSDNNLLAETDNDKNKYDIKGFTNNRFTHNFKIYTTKSLLNIIKEMASGKEIKIFVVSSFDILGFFPISLREEIII